MNIAKAQAVPGWMGDEELRYLAATASKSHSIVEVGSWRGRSARVLADNSPGVVFCVDTWAENAYGAAFPGDPEDLYQPNWLWNEFSKYNSDHLASGKIIPVRMTSLQAAIHFWGTCFEMIFIDADHRYEPVVEDIMAWRTLVAEGGILCGHDYVDYHLEVKRAVNELVPRFSVVGTIWTTEEL